ncbi:MAG: serine/threonine-protein kinase [Myxococcota bacterium]
MGDSSHTAQTVDAEPWVADSEGRSPLAGLVRGDSVGRYLILGTLGAGGMGVVYEAYDPSLDRKVAIKLLLPELLGADSIGHGRLMREAQAMAKLSNANVVTVHDVGEADDLVYIAMEYIDGMTMRAWLKDEQPDWRTALDLLTQAGRGLAAAHAVDVVHRDFKPDNVMVTRDERGLHAVVMDFGLAHAVGATPVTAPGRSLPLPEKSGPLLSERLTNEGAMIGTPRYMAPEQITGLETGPATDQFSFCVTLWEAVFGVLPFDGSSIYDIAAAIASNSPTAGPREHAVPRWVRRAALRGLAADPANRWPSMRALLTELANAPTRRRNVGIGGSIVVGGVLISAVGVPNAPGPCEASSKELAGVWDDGRRTEVAAALDATGVPFAPETIARATRELDAYADEWVATHAAACRATHVGKTQSEAMLDLRISCLQTARLSLDATAGALSRADVGTVRKALNVVADLPALARCNDTEALSAGGGLPAEAEADAVAAIEADLRIARASIIAGDTKTAAAAVERAEQASTEVTYAPIVVQTQVDAAHLKVAQGDYEAAEAGFRAAREHAAAAGQWEQVRRATNGRLNTLGYHLRRSEQAAALFDLARGLAAGDPAHEAEAADRIGGALSAAGDFSNAEVELRRALEITESLHPPDHPRTLSARSALVSILGVSGQIEAARIEAEKTVDLMRQTLGPNHPSLANALANLASTSAIAGHSEAAEAAARETLEIRIRTEPPGHPEIVSSHAVLAMVLHEQDRFAEAVPEYEAALEGYTATLGAEHPHVAVVRSNRSTALSRIGRHEEAEREARAALELWLAAHGDSHANTQDLHRAVGAVLAEAGRHAEAIEALDRAWASVTDDCPPFQRGKTAFAMAKSLWELPDRRSEFRIWTTRASEAFAGDGKSLAAARAEVQAWLAERE